jgi:hypothetical protein
MMLTQGSPPSASNPGLKAATPLGLCGIDGSNFLGNESLTNGLEMHDLSIELPGTKTEHIAPRQN